MALKAGYKGIKKCGPGLKYDNVNGILSLEGESSLKLDNLEDVDITTPLQGDVLIYDGEDWVNEQPDSDPTEDSANLVTSGGVYEALQDRVDWASYAETGAVNHLPNNVTNTTKNNITATVDKNRVITLDTGENTASASTSFELFRAKGSDLQHLNGKFLSGCTGGTDETYFIRIGYTESPYTALVVNRDGYTEISGIPNTNDTIAVVIYVWSGTSLNNVKFYPMISDSPNVPYAPYVLTNQQLTTDKLSWSDYAKTGAVNINGTKYYSVSNLAGIDWTLNADGSVSASGTTNAVNSSSMNEDADKGFIAPFTGIFYATGAPNVSGTSILVYDWTISHRAYTDSTKTTTTTDGYYDTPLQFYMEEGHNYSLILRIQQSTTVSNAVFYPMIALNKDAAYTPHAMTNRELTDAVAKVDAYGEQVFLSNKTTDTANTAAITFPNSPYATFMVEIFARYGYILTSVRLDQNGNITAVTDRLKVVDSQSYTYDVTYSGRTLTVVYSMTWNNYRIKITPLQTGYGSQCSVEFS